MESSCLRLCLCCVLSPSDDDDDDAVDSVGESACCFVSKELSSFNFNFDLSRKYSRKELFSFFPSQLASVFIFTVGAHTLASDVPRLPGIPGCVGRGHMVLNMCMMGSQ